MFIAVASIETFDNEIGVTISSSEFFLCDGTGTRDERLNATVHINARYGSNVTDVEFVAGEAADEYLRNQYSGFAQLTTP